MAGAQALTLPSIPVPAPNAMTGSAVAGGIAIDLTGLNEIVEVSRHDFFCVVEPGVTRSRLNSILRDQGLFFPVDPGADATLGGMAATRASGTMTLRYGSMRDNVLGLEAVLASGITIQTGGRARKSSSGYDLTRLFVGSEGTLGIITRLTLKLHPMPEAILAASIAFKDFPTAIRLVTDLLQLGLPVARAEFMDELAIEAVCRHLKRDEPRAPTLFLEFHGDEAQVGVARDQMVELCTEAGALRSAFASSSEERHRIWEARHSVAYAERTLKPSAKAMVTDVCVPLSRLAECVTETQRDLASTGLLAPMVGHVGDGNFHLSIMVDPTRACEVATAEAFHERLVLRALNAGGTATGEHGIGLGKRKFLKAEHAAGADVMWTIKRALDPQNVLNPHKIFDPAQFGR